MVLYSTTWHVVMITALEKCIQMFSVCFCFTFKALWEKEGRNQCSFIAFNISNIKRVHRHFCSQFLTFNLENCLIQILDQKCHTMYICFINHGNSWKRTRLLLAVGINLSVMNCISQQFVMCVSCITRCHLAVMSHLLQLPRLRDIGLAKLCHYTAYSLGKRAHKVVGSQNTAVL